MKFSSEGYLQIKASVAAEALPVEGLVVRITGNEEGNGGIDYSVRTSRDGLADIIKLPTPDVSYSLSPMAAERPYATYDIEASHPDYYPKKITDVAVFPGVVSVLILEMVPNAGLERNVTPPLDTNYSTVKENEELE